MMRSLWPWWPQAWNPFHRWLTTGPQDFETVLARLEEEIDTVETTLVDIKARKRRTIHNVLQVMLTLWILSLVIVWALSSFIWGREWAASRSMAVVLLLLGTPLFIAVLHRLVTAWFRRLERAQESHLQSLRKQQRQKINELKKATDFDHLRSLLERYDTDSQPAATTSSPKHLLQRRSTTSLRRRRSRDAVKRTKEAPASVSTPERSEGLAPAITGLPIPGVRQAQNDERRQGSEGPARAALMASPRGWMDKVADLILGTDPYGATPEDQQYALICRHCFRHNGLVPKSEMNEIQYVCPHCHQFNSRRPSSQPVSSPFAAKSRKPEQDMRAPSPPPVPSTPVDHDVPPRVVRPRRSARLRNATPDQPQGEDAMQLDE